MFSKNAQTIFIILLFFMFTLFSCQESTQPREEQISEIDQYYYETVENDIDMINAGGFPIEGSSGVFSIDWNSFVGRDLIQVNAPVAGHVFAVAYNESADSGNLGRFLRIGQDIGSVFLKYSETNIELNKIDTPHGGIFYTNYMPQFIGRRGRIGQIPSRGNRSFGNHQQVINFNGPAANFVPVEFIADTEYKFEIGGSDNLSPFEVSITSPSELVNLTSHGNRDEIDVENDLKLTWDGASDGQVIIRVTAPQIYRRDERRGPIKYTEGILETTQANTGEFIIPKERLQTVVENSILPMLWIHVSAFQVNEVEHESKKYHGIMRTGDQVIVRVKE